MRIPEDVADILEKVRELSEDSLHGEIFLSDAMWEINELISELLENEYHE